jgi:hypothetical protein
MHCWVLKDAEIYLRMCWGKVLSATVLEVLDSPLTHIHTDREWEMHLEGIIHPP